MIEDEELLAPKSPAPATISSLLLIITHCNLALLSSRAKIRLAVYLKAAYFRFLPFSLQMVLLLYMRNFRWFLETVKSGA